MDHFLIEDKYWCYLKKTYVDPEQPQCDKFEPYLRKAADKHI